MCGIVGLISRAQIGLPTYASDVFTQMLQFDTIRGPDSTGCFGVTREGLVDIIKGNADGYVFTHSQPYHKFKSRIYGEYKFVIGHNRKATYGKITPHNAHPFKERNIVLVHNGTIFNAEDLNKEAEVDSHAIAHALADHNAVKALGQINGAFALIWFDSDDKTLNLARNSQRPLAIHVTDQCYTIASEPGLAAWLHGREGRKFEKIEQVPVGKILQIKLDKLDQGFTEIPYEEYKAPVKIYQWPDAGITDEAKTSNFPTDLSPKPKHSGDAVPIKYKAKEKANLPIVTPMISLPTDGFKKGDTIRFKVEEIKEPLDPKGQTMLGHPFVSKLEVDANMVVHSFLKAPVDMNYYLSTELWEGRCVAVRPMVSTPVIYVTDLIPVYSLVDAQGNEIKKDEIEKAVKICNLCNTELKVAEVKDSIVRKTAAGDWRCICPKCLVESIQNATPKQETTSTNVIH